MGRVLFIADTHFGHENIIKLCNRPFSNGIEMENWMRNAWNAKVQSDDEVYILGDFAFKCQNATNILKSLKGKKYLIVGNHDGKNLKNPDFKRYFEGIWDLKSINLNNNRIVLCHYPMCEWEGYFRGSYHIYGHIHNSTDTNAYKMMYNQPRALNAGADIINFTPATLEELVMYNKQFKALHQV